MVSKIKLKIQIPQHLEQVALKGLEIFNSYDDVISTPGTFKKDVINIALDDFAALWPEWKKLLVDNPEKLKELGDCVRDALRQLTDEQMERKKVAFHFAQKLIN